MGLGAGVERWDRAKFVAASRDAMDAAWAM
jgi:hypothetical protein